MGFRRNDVCDQRRRRVLIEENLGDSDLDPTAGMPSATAPSPFSTHRLLPSYTDAALADRHSPITSVIPQRVWTVVLLLLAGLASIAGIEALYGKQHLLPHGTWASDFSAFDVQAPGGLAAWFCSLILAVAAFQGLQIYRLRRHKTDDYRGRYRVWLWVPMVLFLMATGVATHIHHDLANLVSGMAGITAPAEGGVLWPLACGTLWTLVSLRLVFEVRECRTSLVSLLLGTVCYLTVTSAFLFTDFAVGEMGEIKYVMVTTTIAMVGHLTTFLTVATYGRHVYLDSQGILPARTGRLGRKKLREPDVDDLRSEEENAEPKQSSRKRVRAAVIPINVADDGAQSNDSLDDSIRKQPNKSRKRKSKNEPAAELSSESDAQAASPSDLPDGNRKLSKAERRRLRKQKRREQRRNAA